MTTPDDDAAKLEAVLRSLTDAHNLLKEAHEILFECGERLYFHGEPAWSRAANECAARAQDSSDDRLMNIGKLIEVIVAKQARNA